MSEQAPNVLSSEEQTALDKRIEEVAEVANEADFANRDDMFQDKHNKWHDGNRGENSTRVLGQSSGHHRVEHRGTPFGGIRDTRTDVKILEKGREIHSFSDRRSGNTVTYMDVNRGGEKKHLRSENPLVFKMLSGIALKDVEKRAKDDLANAQRKAA